MYLVTRIVAPYIAGLPFIGEIASPNDIANALIMLIAIVYVWFVLNEFFNPRGIEVDSSYVNRRNLLEMVKSRLQGKIGS